MEQVVIEFERGIPRRTAEKLLQDIGLQGRVKDMSQVEHFDFDFSQFVADITIIFNQDFTRSVFSNVVAAAALAAFATLTKLVIRKKEKKPSIEVRFEGKNSTIRFTVEGDLQDATHAMHGFLDTIKKGFIEAVMNDPKNFDQRSQKKKVRYHYNKQLKLRLVDEKEEQGEARFANEGELPD